MGDYQNPKPGARLMSEWLEELPENTVIDKGITGCGATTLAIKQKQDTIIAVPFTALIVNKINQPEHKDVLLGLYGRTDDGFKAVISDYLDTHSTVKIMTTYNSLPKACRTLQDLGRDPYKQMHLVIDEWHLLKMSYGFRGETIRDLLNEAQQFQNVTYLSATPVERKYWFPEMEGLRDWKIEWPNATKVKVWKVRTPSPIRKTAAMCLNRINDGGDVNYHFFLNSVSGIADAIRMGGLKPENCRVVCSPNSDNEKKLPEGFSISLPGDPVKPINFYTSTCFEGCDLFDENGRTFIVCDPIKENTMLDISTSMLQICGRIRDSRYRGQLTLIYNTTRYEEDESLDLFIKRLEGEKAEAKINADWLNSGPSTSLRRQMLSCIEQYNSPFIRFDDENCQIIIDQNMIDLEIISYMIIHDIYATQVNLDNGFEKNGFVIVGNEYADGNFVELMSTERMSFKDCCEKYNEIKPEPGTYSLLQDERLARLRNLCPEACDAVDKLGIEEVRRMKYHRQNIHRKLVTICSDPQREKIQRELAKRLKRFNPYTTPEIKQILNEVYHDVGLERTPKATELEEWLGDRYLIRKTKKAGKDAYNIVGDRFMSIANQT